MRTPQLYIGGGFDVMHSGHRKFIQRSVDLYREKIDAGMNAITIGLNSDDFLNSKKGVERPFFTYDWRRNDMESFLQGLNIPEIHVSDEEAVELSNYKVVVLEGGPMAEEWKDQYNLFPVPEIGGQHTSTIKTSIDEAREKSGCKMIQVGSVLVRNGDIITTGYNGLQGSESCDKEKVFYSAENKGGENNLSIGVPCNSSHAEIMAMVNARPGDDLIISLSPCIDCAKEIVTRRIRRVVYMEEYYDPSPGIDILNNGGVHVRQAGIGKSSVK